MWEYMVVRRVGDPREPEIGTQLNDLGREGWELVSVLHTPSFGIMELYLKRQQPQGMGGVAFVDGDNAGVCGGGSGRTGTYSVGAFGRTSEDQEVETARVLLVERQKAQEEPPEFPMHGCISYIQRKMEVPYSRAHDIMLRMENVGLISEPDSNGRRRWLAYGGTHTGKLGAPVST